MSRTAIARAVLVATMLVGTVLATAGCDGGRGATREWLPTDHDHAEGPTRQVAAASARAPAGAVDPSLVELSWQQKCATCHGPLGKGDGPQGSMVMAPDLTRDDTLARLKDEDIAIVIKHGRGRMPAFELPPSVVEGLIRRIRGKGLAR